jgi:hypothetical protein
MKSKPKLGISLIAVLMFMLAATTASIIVFRWISQENFASGARLKKSEAYQASQAGLEAVKGWLANKGADAGALIKVFEDQTPIAPVLLISNTGNDNTVDLLAGTGFRARNRRQQNFQVYLTGVNSESQPYKLKFLSVGTARDGSKHSQAGIFDVEGLYKTTIYKPAETTVPDIPAFYGGISANTQGRFSSAIIQGDLNVAGISTHGNLLVTGNMTTSDNGERRIGCKSATDNTRAGDMYVFGYVNIRGFTICGDAYIGGLLTTTSNPQFLKNLYADGGVNSNGFSVAENMTLGGNIISGSALFTIDGNLVIDPEEGKTAQINTQDDSKMNVKGSVWSMNALGIFSGSNNTDKYGNIAMGGANKNLLISSTGLTHCAITTLRGCGNNASRWFQNTTGTNYVHFTSQATHAAPSLSNKPEGANLLTSMAEQIEDCPKPGGGTYKCVSDPLEVPQETRDIWLAKGKLLDTLVNIAADTAQLPAPCIRLVRRPKNSNANYDSHWNFGDGLPTGSTAAIYPSMGSNRQYNFVKAANDCYAGLLANDPKKVLYQNGDQGKKFLPLVVNNPDEKSPTDHFNGNFIFAYETNMSATMKLPSTTDNSNVFIYFKEGATGSMPLESSCFGLPSPCKRNYFIFSEKDIAGSSGTSTITGAVFLANGAKITGSLPDAYIEFNANLYRDLVEAGIIAATDERWELQGSGPQTIADVYHIPATSHLKVKLESQYASEEDPGGSINAKPAILVLPRVIYLKPGDISSAADLQKYYRVLYLNGATKPAVEATPVCPENVSINGAMNVPCTLASTSATCGDSNLCNNHPFYVVVVLPSSSSGYGSSSSSDGAEPSSSSETATLACSGLGANAGIEGTAISLPILTCSNTGAPPTGAVSWSPNINWSNPAPGLYQNITATATCGTTTGVVSNSCGDLQINSSTTLACEIAGSNNVAAGALISDDKRILTCSNGATAINVTYNNINWNSPAAGTYSSIIVEADCGISTDLTANCTGSLTVVGLECAGLPQFVQPAYSIAEPTLTCRASGNNATGASWLGRPNNNTSWIMPETGEFNITVSASCDGVHNLTASCGTARAAAINCTNLQQTVMQGGSIAMPSISCNNGSSATNIEWAGNPPGWAVASGTAIGTSYAISATANCGSFTNLAASCGNVTVSNNNTINFTSDSEQNLSKGGTYAIGSCHSGNGIFCMEETGAGFSWSFGNSSGAQSSWSPLNLGACSVGTVFSVATTGTVRCKNRSSWY